MGAPVSLPADAESLLPHSGRMCCIDSLVAFDEQRATAFVRLVPEHVLLDGQGVLDPCAYIELGAQAAGAMHAANQGLAGTPPELAILAGIQKFTVKGAARAHDSLRIDICLLGELEGMSSLSFSVQREEAVLAEGRLKVFMPGPGFSFGQEG